MPYVYELKNLQLDNNSNTIEILTGDNKTHILQKQMEEEPIVLYGEEYEDGMTYMLSLTFGYVTENNIDFNTNGNPILMLYFAAGPKEVKFYSIVGK